MYTNLGVSTIEHLEKKWKSYIANVDLILTNATENIKKLVNLTTIICLENVQKKFNSDKTLGILKEQNTYELISEIIPRLKNTFVALSCQNSPPNCQSTILEQQAKVFYFFYEKLNSTSSVPEINITIQTQNINIKKTILEENYNKFNLMSNLAIQLAEKIDRQNILRIFKETKNTVPIDGDDSNKLIENLYKESLEIFAKTHRARGNILICNLNDDIINIITSSKIVECVLKESSLPTNECLMLYRGTSLFDCAAIYSPFIPAWLEDDQQVVCYDNCIIVNQDAIKKIIIKRGKL